MDSPPPSSHLKAKGSRVLSTPKGLMLAGGRELSSAYLPHAPQLRWGTVGSMEQIQTKAAFKIPLPSSLQA